MRNDIEKILNCLQNALDRAEREVMDEYEGDKDKWAESCEDYFYENLNEDGELYYLFRS